MFLLNYYFLCFLMSCFFVLVKTYKPKKNYKYVLFSMDKLRSAVFDLYI